MESVSIVETEKKTKKTKSSKKAVQQPSEEFIENTQPVEAIKEIEESEPTEVEKIIEETNEKVDISEDEEISLEDLFKMIDDVADKIATISENDLKQVTSSKDHLTHFSKKLKQINKADAKINENYTNILLKESMPSIKKKDKPKKQTDKSMHNVHIRKKTFDEVLKFMKLEPDTLVSQTEVQRAINGFVTQQKQAGNTDIMVENDKRKFKIIGELADLFKFFEKQIKSGNYNGVIPEIKDHISYADIFTYTKFCFEPTKTKTK
jgi:hypothetical protein